MTAPEHRLGDALKLAHEIAEMCTPSEVARAKEQAKGMDGMRNNRRNIEGRKFLAEMYTCRFGFANLDHP